MRPLAPTAVSAASTAPSLLAGARPPVASFPDPLVGTPQQATSNAIASGTAPPTPPLPDGVGQLVAGLPAPALAPAPAALALTPIARATTLIAAALQTAGAPTALAVPGDVAASIGGPAMSPAGAVPAPMPAPTALAPIAPSAPLVAVVVAASAASQAVQVPIEIDAASRVTRPVGAAQPPSGGALQALGGTAATVPQALGDTAATAQQPLASATQALDSPATTVRPALAAATQALGGAGATVQQATTAATGAAQQATTTATGATQQATGAAQQTTNAATGAAQPAATALALGGPIAPGLLRALVQPATGALVVTPAAVMSAPPPSTALQAFSMPAAVIAPAPPQGLLIANTSATRTVGGVTRMSIPPDFAAVVGGSVARSLAGVPSVRPGGLAVPLAPLFAKVAISAARSTSQSQTLLVRIPTGALAGTSTGGGARSNGRGELDLPGPAPRAGDSGGGAPGHTPIDALIARALRNTRRHGHDHPVPLRLLQRIVGRLRNCLPYLAPHQRQVLALRVGLDGGAPLSATDVARTVGISRAREIRLERRAIRALRTAMRTTNCAASGGGGVAGDGGVLAGTAGGLLRDVTVFGSTPAVGLHRRSSGDGRHGAASSGAPDGGRLTAGSADQPTTPRWLEPLGPGRLDRNILLLLTALAFIIGVVVGERRRRA
jgi:hypothetical protein